MQRNDERFKAFKNEIYGKGMPQKQKILAEFVEKLGGFENKMAKECYNAWLASRMTDEEFFIALNDLRKVKKG